MANYTVVDGELYHYGVKGMRWGVRRAQKKLQKIDRKADKKGWSDDAREVAKIKTKKPKQMSNNDLRKLNERNQLEITNRDLKQKQSRGRRAVKGFIATAGTITAVAGAYKVYKKVGKDALGTKVGNKVLDKIGDVVLRSLKP